ncbi:MAG: dihydrodipicolinate synthase family protein, partial [Acidimicrobiia bacterium]
GADGALVMPPPPGFLSDTGLKNYYVGLAEDVDLPAVLYKRGGWPGDEALIDIVQSTSAAGVKYGDTDVNAFATTVEKAGSEAAWTCGVAERWAPFFHLAGSAGFTSGLSNFAPSLALDMDTALNATDYSKAMELRAICLPFEDIRNRDGGANIVAAVKVAMDAHGLAGGRVRPPFRDLDEAVAAEVEEITAAWFPVGTSGEPIE